MRGMGSLPMQSMELEKAEVGPSLTMIYLRDSLFIPLEMLPCSLRGVSKSVCWSIARAMAADVPPRAL